MVVIATIDSGGSPKLTPAVDYNRLCWIIRELPESPLPWATIEPNDRTGTTSVNSCLKLQ